MGQIYRRNKYERSRLGTIILVSLKNYHYHWKLDQKIYELFVVDV
jgi:hypothetical protein